MYPSVGYGTKLNKFTLNGFTTLAPVRFLDQLAPKFSHLLLTLVCTQKIKLCYPITTVYQTKWKLLLILKQSQNYEHKVKTMMLESKKYFILTNYETKRKALLTKFFKRLKLIKENHKST